MSSPSLKKHKKNYMLLVEPGDAAAGVTLYNINHHDTISRYAPRWQLIPLRLP